MTTEMQEIAITEDKPLLTGQADAVKVRDDGTQGDACTHTCSTCCTCTGFCSVCSEWICKTGTSAHRMSARMHCCVCNVRLTRGTNGRTWPDCVFSVSVWRCRCATDASVCTSESEQSLPVSQTHVRDCARMCARSCSTGSVCWVDVKALREWEQLLCCADVAVRTQRCRAEGIKSVLSLLTPGGLRGKYKSKQQSRGFDLPSYKAESTELCHWR